MCGLPRRGRSTTWNVVIVGDWVAEEFAHFFGRTYVQQTLCEGEIDTDVTCGPVLNSLPTVISGDLLILSLTRKLIGRWIAEVITPF